MKPDTSTNTADANRVCSTDGSAWLDIATAPKDGTNILATDGELIALVWWSDEWRDYGDIGAAGQCDFAPTHWMHLPTLPNS